MSIDHATEKFTEQSIFTFQEERCGTNCEQREKETLPKGLERWEDKLNKNKQG